MLSRLIANRESSRVVYGKAWREARDKVLGMIDNGYQLITIVGRPGSGKTHIALNICESIRQNWLCLYTDASTLQGRDLRHLVYGAIRDSWGEVDRLRSMVKDRAVKAAKRFIKARYDELLRSAFEYPVEAITLMHDLSNEVGLRGVVLTIDEGALSQDDESMWQYTSALHALRNIAPKLGGLRVISTMLPDVVDRIAKIDPPLFEILLLGIVNLPDYVTAEDAREVLGESLTQMLAEVIEQVPLTMRQLICISAFRDLAKCGISGVEVHVE